jgi:hypothetical protein
MLIKFKHVPGVNRNSSVMDIEMKTMQMIADQMGVAPEDQTREEYHRVIREVLALHQPEEEDDPMEEEAPTRTRRSSRVQQPVKMQPFPQEVVDEQLAIRIAWIEQERMAKERKLQDDAAKVSIRCFRLLKRC